MRFGTGLPGPFFVSFHVPTFREMRADWDEDTVMLAEHMLERRDGYVAEGNEKKAWAANHALCSLIKGLMRRNGTPIPKTSEGKYPWLDFGTEEVVE